MSRIQEERLLKVAFRRGVVTTVEEDVSRNRGGGTWDVKYDDPEGAP